MNYMPDERMITAAGNGDRGVLSPSIKLDDDCKNVSGTIQEVFVMPRHM